MSMKNSSDTIGNRTRDLPTCSIVPQATALPAACPRAYVSILFKFTSIKYGPVNTGLQISLLEYPVKKGRKIGNRVPVLCSVQLHKHVWKSGGTSPDINLHLYMDVSGQPLYPWGQSRWYPLDRRKWGPRAGPEWGGWEKRSPLGNELQISGRPMQSPYQQSYKT